MIAHMRGQGVVASYRCELDTIVLRDDMSSSRFLRYFVHETTHARLGRTRLAHIIRALYAIESAIAHSLYLPQLDNAESIPVDRDHRREDYTVARPKTMDELDISTWPQRYVERWEAATRKSFRATVENHLWQRGMFLLSNVRVRRHYLQRYWERYQEFIAALSDAAFGSSPERLRACAELWLDPADLELVNLRTICNSLNESCSPRNPYWQDAGRLANLFRPTTEGAMAAWHYVSVLSDLSSHDELILSPRVRHEEYEQVLLAKPVLFCHFTSFCRAARLVGQTQELVWRGPSQSEELMKDLAAAIAKHGRINAREVTPWALLQQSGLWDQFRELPDFEHLLGETAAFLGVGPGDWKEAAYSEQLKWNSFTHITGLVVDDTLCEVVLPGDSIPYPSRYSDIFDPLPQPSTASNVPRKLLWARAHSCMEQEMEAAELCGLFTFRDWATAA
jgi:hypothetical protein